VSESGRSGAFSACLVTRSTFGLLAHRQSRRAATKTKQRMRWCARRKPRYSSMWSSGVAAIESPA